MYCAYTRGKPHYEEDGRKEQNDSHKPRGGRGRAATRGRPFSKYSGAGASAGWARGVDAVRSRFKVWTPAGSEIRVRD